MNELVLHVGAHKTGSTSIQKTLSFYREALQKCGIAYYPGSNHTDFYRGFTDVPTSFHQYYRGWRGKIETHKTRKRIRENIVSRRDAVQLVSAEDISLLTETGLLELKHFLHESCGITRVRIVCYLRQPLDYLNSNLQQYIKPGLTDLNDLQNDAFDNYRLQGCPEFSGGAQAILDRLYFPIPQRLLHVFGEENVSFVGFEKAASDGLTRTLLGYVAPQEDFSWLEEKRFNDSLSHEACILLAAYNARQPLLLGDELRLNRKRNRNKSVVPVLREVAGRKPVLFQPQAIDLQRLNDRIDELNRLIGEALLTPLESMPEKFLDVSLCSFSAESVASINALLHPEMSPLPSGGGIADRESVDATVALFERRYGGLFARLRRRLMSVTSNGGTNVRF